MSAKDAVVLRCVLCSARLTASQQISCFVPCGHLLHSSCAEHFVFQCQQSSQVNVSSSVGRSDRHSSECCGPKENYVEFSPIMRLSVSPPRKAESIEECRCSACRCEVTGLFKKVYLANRDHTVGTEGKKEGDTKKIESRSKLVVARQSKNRKLQRAFQTAKHQVTFLQRKCAHLHAQIAVNSSIDDPTGTCTEQELRLAPKDEASISTLSGLPLTSLLNMLVETGEDLRSTRERAKKVDARLERKQARLTQLKEQYAALKEDTSYNDKKENTEPPSSSGSTNVHEKPPTLSNSSEAPLFQKMPCPLAPGAPAFYRVEKQRTILCPSGTVAPPSSPLLQAAATAFSKDRGREHSHRDTGATCTKEYVDVRALSLSRSTATPSSQREEDAIPPGDHDETTLLLASSSSLYRKRTTSNYQGSNKDCPVTVDSAGEEEEIDADCDDVIVVEDNEDCEILDVDACSSVSISSNSGEVVLLEGVNGAGLNDRASLENGIRKRKRSGSLESGEEDEEGYEEDNVQLNSTRLNTLTNDDILFMTNTDHDADDGDDDGNYLADFAATLLLPAGGSSLPALGRSTGRSIRDLPRREDRLFQLDLKDLLSS